MENITFYLACWGATLSTVKAVMDFLKGRKEVRASFKIVTEVLSDKLSIKLSFVNTSFRPLTILKYDLIYAANEDLFQLIKSYEPENPIKLQESETYRAVVSVEDLRNSALASNIEQKFYHLLYIRVWTTSLGVGYKVIEIPKDESDIERSTGLSFILTDRLLGLPERKPFIHRRDQATLK